MKRAFLLSLFLALCTLPLHPLEGWFTGLGAEANAHTRDGIAAGGGLSFGLDLNSHFALGTKAAFSWNFDTLGAIEPLAFFRYYIPPVSDGMFLQAETGAAVYLERGRAYPAFSGGLALGRRFIFGRKIYIEVSIRGGYPFAWGIGLTAGIAARKERPLNEKESHE